MKAINVMKMSFYSRSVNEGFARGALAAFIAQADPTVPQLADIKTAVSEAVTNSIVHAYPQQVGLVYLTVWIYPEGQIKVTVMDKGVGIENIQKAMEPMYTTGDPEERAGLGFAVMQSFMDKVKVTSSTGKGTRVTMWKQVGAGR
ncbi:MAG: anti-sigma F factor [Candidatus Fournierella pullistercoris]|uniref:Anti-sigma F factor n=1 Tax=Candidatus Allofournierella pullistercoris TaxID=2838597 RepID=A0A948WRU2_9FIRM|nr:anti-sigma F factor [Candidatus Fournierella pullistercoris]